MPRCGSNPPPSRCDAAATPDSKGCKRFCLCAPLSERASVVFGRRPTERRQPRSPSPGPPQSGHPEIDRFLSGKITRIRRESEADHPLGVRRDCDRPSGRRLLLSRSDGLRHCRRWISSQVRCRYSHDELAMDVKRIESSHIPV